MSEGCRDLSHWIKGEVELFLHILFEYCGEKYSEPKTRYNGDLLTPSAGCNGSSSKCETLKSVLMSINTRLVI